MKKQIVNMSNWELNIYDNEYSIEGVADYHPRLGKDAYISYTTKVEKCYLDEDILGYETKNTIYLCPLKYMSTNPYGSVVTSSKEELMKRADESEFLLDKIIAASAYIAMDKAEENEFAKHIVKLQKVGQEELKNKENEENKRLIEIVKGYEDAVYIEVSQISTGSVMAYHIGDCVGVVQPEIHAGMVQNSILYLKQIKEDCTLDFRYFPSGNLTMETYSWSDTIKSVVIRNVKNETIKFNTTNIESGEMQVFVKQV